jgi:IPT/TIG domain
MTVYSTLTVDLQSISPPGGFGPALVTLSGNGFVDLGGPLCRFQNGTVEVTVAATINSDISISCTAPGNMSGNANVSISLDGTNFTNTVNFFFGEEYLILSINFVVCVPNSC